MKATLFGLGVATAAGKTYLKEKFGELRFRLLVWGPKNLPLCRRHVLGGRGRSSGAVLPRLLRARAAGAARARVAAVHASRRLLGARGVRAVSPGRRPRVFSSPLSLRLPPPASAPLPLSPADAGWEKRWDTSSTWKAEAERGAWKDVDGDGGIQTSQVCAGRGRLRR